VVVGTLLGTALAVGLAELYSEVIGSETRTHHRVERAELKEMADDAVAVAFGIAFPAVFFVLTLLGVLSLDSAFKISRWSGLGLIGFYAYLAGRLAGESNLRALLQAAAVAAIGGVLIVVKALIH
jgi:hypothetical protein